MTDPSRPKLTVVGGGTPRTRAQALYGDEMGKCWTMLPNILARWMLQVGGSSKHITQSEYILVVLILTARKDGSGVDAIQVSQELLAYWLGVGRARVSNIVQSLERKGYILVARRKRCASTYDLRPLLLVAEERYRCWRESTGWDDADPSTDQG